MPKLWGASPVGRGNGGRSYVAQTVDRSGPSRRSRGSEDSSSRGRAIRWQAVVECRGLARAGTKQAKGDRFTKSERGRGQRVQLQSESGRPKGAGPFAARARMWGAGAGCKCEGCVRHRSRASMGVQDLRGRWVIDLVAAANRPDTQA